jgi:hypothetical protein
MAGSGVNLYQYAGGDPVNGRDPTGRCFILSCHTWQGVSNTVAGWGDAVTGGATREIRGALSLAQPDFSSSGYQGGAVAGIATAVLIPGDEEAGAVDEGGSLLRHYTTDEGAEGIHITGTIKPSPDGYTYLTPDHYGNGPSAQAGLDLSHTPTGYFEFPAPSGAPTPSPVPGGTGTQVPVLGPVKLPPGTRFNPF